MTWLLCAVPSKPQRFLTSKGSVLSLLYTDCAQSATAKPSQKLIKQVHEVLQRLVLVTVDYAGGNNTQGCLIQGWGRACFFPISLIDQIYLSAWPVEPRVCTI